MGIVEELVQAREAFERRDWAVAHNEFSGVPRSRLTSDDLVRHGISAYLLGDNPTSVAALQQAYRAALAADETLAAVRIAFWAALVLINGGEVALGRGWGARAHRLMQSQQEDVVETGYLLTHDMHESISRGDFRTALAIAPRIAELGRRFGDPDLVALGLCSHGRLLFHADQVPQGLALLDEAMVEVASGDVSAVIAGLVYCTMVDGCQEISDLARAEEWTAALSRWCESQPDLVPFTGQCAVHRGQIMALHGALPEALAELDLAYQRYLSSAAPQAAGLALAERGDILRIRGQWGEAEAAYAEAMEFGHEPQPGLALLWLATGRTSAAEGAVRRLLTEGDDPVRRSRLLPAVVEIMVACNNLETARSGAHELTAIAVRFGLDALQARAAYAMGLVDLTAGDAARALPELQRSRRLWTAVGSPYDIARARMLVGHAYRELGDEQSAMTEFTAALEKFRSLGAVPAAQSVEQLLSPSLPGGLTAREVEVLRLVSSGMSNGEIAAEMMLSTKTVARHLSNIFTKIDVSSRTAAATFAHEHHLVG